MVTPKIRSPTTQLFGLLFFPKILYLLISSSVLFLIKKHLLYTSRIFPLHMIIYLNLFTYWLFFFSFSQKYLFTDTKMHIVSGSVSSNFTTAFDIWSFTIVKIPLFSISIQLYPFDLLPYLTVYFLTPFYPSFLSTFSL